ncbi:MAG: hypothetical protein EZS28_046336 [Streblomastix strix]|uniref:Uncharacterized protein n=1 Tax=Streblomastix strix TaxID=222440 RepID=A0A5J4TIP8_9EUKA|nr:MAG: hypothetical protein EZS28_046336 [Streblomastix strix]
MDVSQQKRGNVVPNGDIYTFSPQGGDSMLSPFEFSFLPLSYPGFLPNPQSELRVQTSTINITNIPFLATSVEALDELRYKSIDDRERATKTQDLTSSGSGGYGPSGNDSQQKRKKQGPKW